MCNAYRAVIWSKTVAKGFHHLTHLMVVLCESQAARYPPYIGLGETNNAPRLCEAITFTHNIQPLLSTYDDHEKSRIDQIKTIVTKVERLQDIHHAKRCVGQLLCPRSCIGIGNHHLTDINACHLHLRMPKGHIEHPTSRTATEIQHLSS